MIDYFNIKVYEKALSAGVPAMMRVLNALIEATNEGRKLPKYLIVILDSDIVSDLQRDDKIDSQKELTTYVNWLMRQIDIHIRQKKLQHLEVNPGAVLDEFPTVIYILMVKRMQFYPKGSRLARLCTLHSKFNECVNNAAARREAKVLSIRLLSTQDCFDKKALLSIKGKHLYWDELDKLLERFERGKIKLLPKTPNSHGHTYKSDATRNTTQNYNSYGIPQDDTYFTQAYKRQIGSRHRWHTFYEC